jgi:hypothetical protein
MDLSHARYWTGGRDRAWSKDRNRKQVSMALALARGVFVTFTLLALAACGGGSAPPQSNVLAVPPGATIVCSTGQPPPCH